MGAGNDPRKEDMGKAPERDDREEVARARDEEHDDGFAGMGREQGVQTGDDIIPAQQEEGLGQEEFIDSEANRSTDRYDVERQSIRDDTRSDVERDSLSIAEEEDVERESIAGDEEDRSDVERI
jgi:hypothetical protein